MQFWYVKPQNVNEVVDSFGGDAQGQPSQRFPFRLQQPPRMDNFNQPWYGGSRQAFKGPAENQMVDSVTEDSEGQDVYKVSDVWGILSSWFGGAGAKANLNVVEDSPGVSPVNAVYNENPTLGSNIYNQNPMGWDYT